MNTDNYNKKVSVIMPVYNVDDFLLECLESVDRQTYKNFELIIIDDGSTDKSGEICDSFCATHPYSRVIHKENGGVSVARNTGMEVATGDYIVFIDSDDIISESYLAALVKLMAESNDEMALVGYETEDVNKLEDLSTMSSTVHDVDYIYDNIIRNLGIGGFLWNKIFNRTLIEKEQIRFLKGVVIWEDMYFVLQYLKNISQVNCSQIKLYYYRQRSTSAISNMTLEKKFGKIEIARKICNFEKSGCQQFHDDAIKNYLRTYFDYCWTARKRKELEKAMKKEFIADINKYHGLKYFRTSNKVKILMIKFL